MFLDPHVEGEACQQRAPPAVGVAQRPGDQRPDGQPGQAGGDSELGGRGTGAQVAGEVRQLGQVAVDGQWSQGHERGEQDDESGSPAGGVVAHASVRHGDAAADRGAALDHVGQGDRVVGVRDAAVAVVVGEQGVSDAAVGLGPLARSDD